MMAGHPKIRMRARPTPQLQGEGAPLGILDEGREEPAPAHKPPSDYTVGYGKPPVATRFGGPRGNRSGRKKGSRDRNAIIRDELDAKVEVPGHGKLSKYQLALRQLINQAAKGDHKAIIAVYRLGVDVDRAEVRIAQQASAAEPAAMMEPEEVSATGQAILYLFAEEIRAGQPVPPDTLFRGSGQ